MAEGLTPSEAAKELEHHRHGEQGAHGEHRREVIAILEAALLSVVTVVTAWAGYSAAKWGTESRLDLAHGSALRIEANRAFAVAAENRNFDASAFNAWFTAYTLDNREKMTIAERRFQPGFRVAFDAWRATDPDHNPSALPGPTYMPVPAAGEGPSQPARWTRRRGHRQWVSLSNCCRQLRPDHGAAGHGAVLGGNRQHVHGQAGPRGSGVGRCCDARDGGGPHCAAAPTPLTADDHSRAPSCLIHGRCGPGARRVSGRRHPCRTAPVRW